MRKPLQAFLRAVAEGDEEIVPISPELRAEIRKELFSQESDKCVWVNPLDGSFSNSWGLNEHKADSLNPYNLHDGHDPHYRLVLYRVIEGNEFEFDRNMRLA